MPCPDLVRVLVPELVPFLTGYTMHALAALAHLVDAWNQADHRNQPHAVVALASVLRTLQSPTSQPLAWFVLVQRLGLHGTHKLIGDLECYETALRCDLRGASIGAAAPHPPGYWRLQFRLAVRNAPGLLGVWLCCARTCVRVDGPSSHLGTDACTELAELAGNGAVWP